MADSKKSVKTGKPKRRDLPKWLRDIWGDEPGMYIHRNGDSVRKIGPHDGRFSNR